MNFDAMPYYQINTGFAMIMAVALTALLALMVILRPTNLLNRLAMVFALACTASTWRYVGALLNPDVFGVKESLLASLFFGFVAIATTAFGAVAWYEHVGDYLDHRRKRKGWRDK